MNIQELTAAEIVLLKLRSPLLFCYRNLVITIIGFLVIFNFLSTPPDNSRRFCYITVAFCHTLLKIPDILYLRYQILRNIMVAQRNALTAVIKIMHMMLAFSILQKAQVLHILVLYK